MGTSKGYIAPTTPDWRKAKRDVTNMVRNRNRESLVNAAKSYSSAMKTASNNTSFSKATSGIISFADSISKYGIFKALENIGRSDLIGKTAEDVFNAILNHYTDNGATIEQSLVQDALARSLENLDINELEDLGSINAAILLKELLINYISLGFALRFEEKIARELPPAETTNILNEMKDYIRSSLYEKITPVELALTNFDNLSRCEYIEKQLNNAYNVFEQIYLEE